MRPILWDDPFENFLFSTVGLEADGRRVDFAFRDDFYGQCWTDADETDAMWRIYSRDKDGVRVQCTPHKLLAGLYRSEDLFRDICYFIGKMSYHTKEELCSLLHDVDFVRSVAFDGNGAKQCETFLLKRKAFSHESEVRLLYQLRATNAAAGDHFFYPLDPLLMFDELVLDPRLDKSTAESQNARLIDLGFTCRVRQSELYQLPERYSRLS